MGNSMEVPQKTKNRVAIWSSKPTPGHISRQNYNSKRYMGTSLVAQWLRIRLPVQGTRVRSLVREGPTCRGATKPVYHNYWAHVPQLLKRTHLEPVSHNYWAHVTQLLKPTHLEPVSHNYWAHVTQLLKPTCLEPMLRNKRSHGNEKPGHRHKE